MFHDYRLEIYVNGKLVFNCNYLQNQLADLTSSVAKHLLRLNPLKYEVKITPHKIEEQPK